jgi:predicted nucleotidyltransferase
MRLSPRDVKQIMAALSPYKEQIPFSIYLFGSRVDPTKRGGDIDLLLLTEVAENTLNLRKLRLEMNVALAQHLGERRVDVTVATLGDVTVDPFLKAIWPSAILLTDPTK